ncbi:MAG: hypothetical protein V7765_12300 [Oleispira sp.]
MINDSIIDFIGHSIMSNDLVDQLKNHEFSTSLKPILNKFGGAVYSAESINANKDIELVFWQNDRFTSNYGIPSFLQDSISDEMVLAGVHYNLDYQNNRNILSIEMPFSLQILDDEKTIIEKIGCKPSSRDVCPWGNAWFVYFQGLFLVVRLSHDNKLIGLSVTRQVSEYRKQVELKQELKLQKKNIKPENAIKVLACRDRLPTSNWKSRVQDGDEEFTGNSISDVEDILVEFILNLSDYTAQKKHLPIYNSVKKIVKLINAANRKNDGFIDTLEREELCEFINSAIRKTGFTLDETTDLTEQWRDW